MAVRLNSMWSQMSQTSQMQNQMNSKNLAYWSWMSLQCCWMMIECCQLCLTHQYWMKLLEHSCLLRQEQGVWEDWQEQRRKAQGVWEDWQEQRRKAQGAKQSHQSQQDHQTQQAHYTQAHQEPVVREEQTQECLKQVLIRVHRQGCLVEVLIRQREGQEFEVALWLREEMLDHFFPVLLDLMLQLFEGFRVVGQERMFVRGLKERGCLHCYFCFK